MLPSTALVVACLGLFLYTAETIDSFGPLLPVDQLVASLTAAGLPLAATLRRRIGRPRKFEAPSRAVTLTLPETVIETLSELDRDLSRAIVGLTKRARKARPPADVAVFGRRGVISVRPTPSLERRIGIELVPLPDGRALIAFDQPRSIAELELLLRDALTDDALPTDDRHVFEGVAAILTEARRSNDVSLLQRNIIVLESAAKFRKSATKSTRRG